MGNDATDETTGARTVVAPPARTIRHKRGRPMKLRPQDRAQRQRGRFALSLAEALFHEARCLVRNLECAVKLIRADAFVAAGHQVRCLEPLVQLHVAPLKHRADGNREFALAWSAAPQADASTLDRRNSVGATTTRATRPHGPDNVLKPLNCRDFTVKMRLEQDAHR
jgi:hypothetical protein